MNHFNRILAVLAFVGSGALVACSDTQVTRVNAALDKYDHALDNFNIIAARVDRSVAKTSATVGPYCGSAEKVGVNLSKIVRGNDRAVSALNGLSSALETWCTAMPTDTQSAIVALTDATVAAQAVLRGG